MQIMKKFQQLKRSAEQMKAHKKIFSHRGEVMESQLQQIDIRIAEIQQEMLKIPSKLERVRFTIEKSKLRAEKRELVDGINLMRDVCAEVSVGDREVVNAAQQALTQEVEAFQPSSSTDLRMAAALPSLITATDTENYAVLGSALAVLALAAIAYRKIRIVKMMASVVSHGVVSIHRSVFGIFQREAVRFELDDRLPVRRGLNAKPA